MRKIVVVMLVVFAAMSLADAPPARAQEPGSAEMEREFVTLLNELRASKGLPGLAVHDELVAKARRWSATMAAEGDIRHSDLSEGIMVAWHRLGENVGMGGSVRALHDALVASPHHYENLTDPGFEYVGIGVVVDPNGTIFVSQEFMEQPTVSVPASPSPISQPQETANGHGEAGAAASFDLTDPPTSPAAPRVRGNADGALPTAPSPAQVQALARDASDPASGAAASDGRIRELLMRPVTSLTSAQWLTLAAVILLAGVASVLRGVALRRVVELTLGR